MNNSTKYLPIFIFFISALVSATQTRATGFLSENKKISQTTSNSDLKIDTCQSKTYKYDNNIAGNGYTFGGTDQIQLGNYFPLDSITSGVIKSVNMCFSSDTFTSGQSCIIYFYKADRMTIFAQSPPFINTAAQWPDTTWITVPCPDIPFAGPFYAMVDYSIPAHPDKNFFDSDNITIQPGFPCGLGYSNWNGTWAPIQESWDGDICTLLQRVNVCEVDPVGITTLSPSTISIYPNPANNFVTIASLNVINKIDLLDFMGQSIYTAENINRKSFKLDVTSFKSGTYFIKVTSRCLSQMTKITVLH